VLILKVLVDRRLHVNEVPGFADEWHTAEGKPVVTPGRRRPTDGLWALWSPTKLPSLWSGCLLL